FAIVRTRLQEWQSQAPELGECLIVELQPPFPVENSDGCRKMIECLRMALQRTLQLLADCFSLRNVDRHPGRASGRHDVYHVVHGPVALYDGRDPVVERRSRSAGCPDFLTCYGSEDF